MSDMSDSVGPLIQQRDAYVQQSTQARSIAVQQNLHADELDALVAALNGSITALGGDPSATSTDDATTTNPPAAA